MLNQEMQNAINATMAADNSQPEQTQEATTEQVDTN